MATIDPSQLSPAERALLAKNRAAQRLPKSLQKARSQYILGKGIGSSTPTGSTLAGKAGRGVAKASAATKAAGKVAGKLAAPVGVVLEGANVFLSLIHI